MVAETIYTEKLFSYGTLQQENVQLATFGRKLIGTTDAISGYALRWLKIHDPKIVATSGIANHPILSHTGDKKDKVDGMVFDLTLDELKQADQYEVMDYMRVKVQLLSGLKAWIYVSSNRK